MHSYTTTAIFSTAVFPGTAIMMTVMHLFSMASFKDAIVSQYFFMIG